MKKLLFLSAFFLAIQANAGFIVHTYYINQEPQGCHHFFVVLTFDNGDGLGEVYQASGEISLGQSCPKEYSADVNSLLNFEEACETSEVLDILMPFAEAYGVDRELWGEADEISVLCSTGSKGYIIVVRDVDAVDRIEVRNTQGVVVKSFDASTTSTSELYDISELQSGIYIVAIGRSQIVIHTAQIIR